MANSHTALISLAVAVAAGTMLMAFSRRLGLPAIVLLLAGGVALGPEVLGVVRADALGAGLGALISFAVGIILFEAGLTLDPRDYRQAPHVIVRLLTVGVMITWLGTAFAVWYLAGSAANAALLAASLVIVTGPTVVGPLLKRIKVKPRVHSILYWEGVLIDPVGVFVAVLCFELIGNEAGLAALGTFGMRVLFGLVVGLGGGLVVSELLRRRAVPEDMAGAFALGCGALTFAAAEAVASESGLLAAIVAGFVLGIRVPPQIRQIRHFKAEIADVLVGSLFILLASRLKLAQFLDFGWPGFAAVAAVMLLVRPLNILVCTRGSGLDWREKTFLSWLAPRGIVAASMASLFRLNLEGKGVVQDPTFVETFTYSVIVCTIAIQGMSANMVAKMLGLKRPPADGWLIIGAHAFGRGVAHFIRGSGTPVALVDTNSADVARARGEGLDAHVADARDESLLEREELLRTGRMLALTDNEDLNLVACARMSDALGSANVRCWVSARGRAAVKTTGRIRPVWMTVPKPSHVSAELEGGETTLNDTATAQALARPGRMVLAARSPSGVRLAENPDGSDVAQDAEAFLELVRSGSSIARLVRPEHVVWTGAATAEAILPDLVDLIGREDPGFDAQEALKELEERARYYPTDLNNGAAVLHLALPTVVSPRVLVARLTGAPAKRTDGTPAVRLVLLLLSPAVDPVGHLNALAEVARLVHDPGIREALLKAGDRDELTEVLRVQGLIA